QPSDSGSEGPARDPLELAPDPTPVTPDDILECLLSLASNGGWSSATPANAAETLGVPLAAVRSLYPAPLDILLAWNTKIDALMHGGEALEAHGSVDISGIEETIPDQLFDQLMRRFDALAPHKAAVAALPTLIARDPSLAVAGAFALSRSMAMALEAAGVSSDGPIGIVRIKALSAVWLVSLRTWLEDDSADMSKTMAGLDKMLKRLDGLANGIGPKGFSPRGLAKGFGNPFEALRRFAPGSKKTAEAADDGYGTSESDPDLV
ncbi:MAG: hypothetical protein ACPGYL_10375, partial [Rhodospirillaceae bacterium]